MARRLGVLVLVDNDVRIYTLGEVTAGAGVGYRDVICLTIGTGLAASLMLGGKLIKGSHDYAGEIGHDPVEGNEMRCKCGKTGCVETIVSAGGIVRLAEERVRGGEPSRLGAVAKLTAADVYRACLDGDETAASVYHYAGTVLARKLMTLLSLTDPELVIIGGGVAEAGNYLLGPIVSFLDGQYLVNERMPAIRKGLLGDEAGLTGAVRYAASFEHV